MTGEVDIRVLSVINFYGRRPQIETQSYIAQFALWDKLSSSCKNTAFGMCAQNMLLDFKKNHRHCAVYNYS